MSTIKANAVTGATTNSDLTLTGDGTGVVKLGDGNLKFPDADGSANQIIESDGAGQLSFVAKPSSGSKQLISTVEASGSASIDITFTPGDADTFEIHLEGVKPATDSVNLFCRTSTDGGSTFDSGGSNYSWGAIFKGDPNTSISGSNSLGDTEIQMTNTNSMGNAAVEHLNGIVTIHNPADTALNTMITWYVTYLGTQATPEVGFCEGAGQRKSAADVDAIQFLMSSGNITSGRFSIHKVTHA